MGGHLMGQLKGQATQYSFQLVKQVDRGPFIVIKYKTRVEYLITLELNERLFLLF